MLVTPSNQTKRTTVRLAVPMSAVELQETVERDALHFRLGYKETSDGAAPTSVFPGIDIDHFASKGAVLTPDRAR
jgi:hypothetical protein